MTNEHMSASNCLDSLFHPGVHIQYCPGYDVKLIRCCPQYDVKLMWRHRGNDIVSVAAICVAAICAAAQLIFLFGRTRLAV